MQPSGLGETGDVRQPKQRKWVTRPAVPMLARFAGKFVLDIMPAALASVIGGFLFSQYQFGHPPVRPALQEVTPASTEMMALVRDEHAMIIDYLKSQMAAEKSRAEAQDAEARVAVDAPGADVKPAVAMVSSDVPPIRHVAAVAPKPAALRARPLVVVAVARAPLQIAQADLTIAQSEPPPPDRLARDPNSLLAKTLDLKDHVVDATRHVVGMIGDVFGSVGERLGGATAAGGQFGAASGVGPTSAQSGWLQP